MLLHVGGLEARCQSVTRIVRGAALAKALAPSSRVQAARRRVSWLAALCGLQLRDSAGLSPASPHYTPSIRASEVPSRSVVEGLLTSGESHEAKASANRTLTCDL